MIFALIGLWFCLTGIFVIPLLYDGVDKKWWDKFNLLGKVFAFSVFGGALITLYLFHIGEVLFNRFCYKKGGENDNSSKI